MDKISKFITNKNLDAEVIMVNNASTDSTLDTLNNFVSGNHTFKEYFSFFI